MEITNGSTGKKAKQKRKCIQIQRKSVYVTDLLSELEIGCCLR